MILDSIIREMREYADAYNVPILSDEGMNYLLGYIKRHNIKSILEVGTAIGYSSILMASVSSDIVITTIERDEKRYLEAVKNIKKSGMEDRIHLVYKDALDVELNDEYDLIFIDAAKAQNIKFFQKFEPCLKKNGTIITDNMSFHGLVNEKNDERLSRNVRQLVRKVRDYKDFLENHKRFQTDFLDIGDGLAVSVRR